MRGVSLFVFAVLSVVFALSHTPQVVSQTVYPSEFNQCITPPLLEKVCVNIKLDVCAIALTAKVTYGSTTVVDINIKDLQEQEYCQPITGTPLSQCLKVSKLTLTPTYAEICPKLVTKMGTTTVVSQTLDCLKLGERCSATDCTSCTNMSGCGWCSSGSGNGDGSCFAKNPLPNTNGPFCVSCGASSWQTANSQCPAALNGGGSFMGDSISPGEAAAITVSTSLVVIGAIVGGLFLCGFSICGWRRKVDYDDSMYGTRSNNGPISLDEVSQDDRGLYRPAGSESRGLSSFDGMGGREEGMVYVVETA